MRYLKRFLNNTVIPFFVKSKKFFIGRIVPAITFLIKKILPAIIGLWNFFLKTLIPAVINFFMKESFKKETRDIIIDFIKQTLFPVTLALSPVYIYVFIIDPGLSEQWSINKKTTNEIITNNEEKLSEMIVNIAATNEYIYRSNINNTIHIIENSINKTSDFVNMNRLFFEKKFENEDIDDYIKDLKERQKEFRQLLTDTENIRSQDPLKNIFDLEKVYQEIEKKIKLYTKLNSDYRSYFEKKIQDTLVFYDTDGTRVSLPNTFNPFSPFLEISSTIQLNIRNVETSPIPRIPPISQPLPPIK